MSASNLVPPPTPNEVTGPSRGLGRASLGLGWIVDCEKSLSKTRRSEVDECPRFHGQPPLTLINQTGGHRGRLCIGQHAHQTPVSQGVGNLIGQDARES